MFCPYCGSELVRCYDSVGESYYKCFDCSWSENWPEEWQEEWEKAFENEYYPFG